MKDQGELFGGSYHWWPPEKDHIFLFKANPLRLDYFESFIRSWNGVKILDVGCGGGYTCEARAQRQAVVFGTDIMEESLRQARDHAVQENLSIDYRLCTPEKLPFDDAEMDAVTCFDVLEHVHDKQMLLSEIYRVLKPGGWFFLDTLNKTFRAKVLTIWLGEILCRFIPRRTHDWQYFISLQDLQRLAKTVGFGDIKFAGIQLDLRRRNKNSLPVRISLQGSTSIIYFGTTMKPLSRI